MTTKERHLKWRNKNREKLRELSAQEYYSSRGQAATRRYRLKTKAAALAAYGTFCQASGCGESRSEALCLDHIANDGAAQRRAGCGVGASFYVWLKKHNYPPGLQVLCHQHNFEKQSLGGSLPDIRTKVAGIPLTGGY